MLLIRIINDCLVTSLWKHAIMKPHPDNVLLIKFYKSLPLNACGYRLNGRCKYIVQLCRKKEK